MTFKNFFSVGLEYRHIAEHTQRFVAFSDESCQLMGNTTKKTDRMIKQDLTIHFFPLSQDSNPANDR